MEAPEEIHRSSAGRAFADAFFRRPLSALRSGLPRVGIVARLGVAFLAVAALALTANSIVEYREIIVHRTLESGIPPLSPALPTQDSPRDATPEALLSEIARFDRALNARVNARAADTVQQFRRAEQALDQVFAQHLDAAKVLNPDDRQRLSAGLAAYKKAGKALIDLADDKQALLDDYSERFESMNARMKSALDGAWKIFGRVIARQSLVQLNAELDEIRQRFAMLSASERRTDADLEAMAASEAAFQVTLERNFRGLVRAEGAEWAKRMQGDFEKLVSLRVDLLRLDEQRHLATDSFARLTSQFTSSIKASAETPAPRTDAGLTSSAYTASEQNPKTTAADAETITSGTDHQPTLLVWLSLAVTGLLLLISISTVSSIVRPVRRLLHAAARIARGEHVQVPRGGLKELDTLAAAFNDMAAQLAAAREAAHDYQQQLEAKVHERTRQLQHLAEHDPLTLLPNRRQLFSLLDAAIERAASNGHFVGVFFLDLDNFKNMNDSMGHAFGDQALRAIAQRLRETAQSFGFAARLGGDEFTVICSGAMSVDAIHAAGSELIHAFQKPFAIHGRELAVSVSIGASIYPDHEQSAEALLRAADAALFRAKALGRSQLTLFTPELLQAASARFTTEQGLRRAIERSEFELVFQPEVRLDTLETGLVEALLRWRLPDGRYASPGEFLEIAEESGLIMEINDWVLRSAIETAARWHHGEWPQVCVAINLSSRQLFDGRFAERVQAVLAEFALPARCLEIELTETVLQTGPATLETLRNLRAAGIAIALDDFGTGYSSIASLQQLPLTRIKLDRSLMANVDTDPRSAAIARAIISLCRGLGLAVTAEGIERPEQLAWLLSSGGIFVQGYLLSRPVRQPDVSDVIARMPQQMQSLLLSLPLPSRSEPKNAPTDPANSAAAAGS